MAGRIRRSLSLAALLAFGMGAALPAAAEGLVGSYLAARQASGSNDYVAAAEYFTKALVRDPGNAMLLESAAVAQLALGRLGAALPIGRQLAQVHPGNQIAEIALLADQIKRADYAGVIAAFEAGRQVGPLVDGLVKAWAHLADGDATEALAAFDAVIATETLAPFGAYHKALALALVGDLEGSERLFSGVVGGGFGATRRGVIAHAQVLAQLERSADALTLLDATFGADPDPAVAALRDRLAAGETPVFDVLASPADGLGEVFFTVAGALEGDADDTYTLIYARIAQALAPRNSEAVLLLAALLERQEQYDLATEAFNLIARDDPSFHRAELGRAETLRAAGRVDAAIEVLDQLSKSHSDLPDVHRARGDLLRSEERYDEAAVAYDAAIAALPVQDASHWILYYARGVSHERGGRWDMAEADFRKALALAPDQPQVLNYLGYSYLEMNANLDEALAMIQRAVDQRPDDGYIVDSLGWALYRLGRYTEAVAPMERAAELSAVDPVINDHLGDVYWAVGRRLEAAFQWRRALSFEPEEKDATRIRRKLEVGLDAVLAEEGAAPITVANGRGG